MNSLLEALANDPIRFFTTNSQKGLRLYLQVFAGARLLACLLAFALSGFSWDLLKLEILYSLTFCGSVGITDYLIHWAFQTEWLKPFAETSRAFTSDLFLKSVGVVLAIQIFQYIPWGFGSYYGASDGQGFVVVALLMGIVLKTTGRLVSDFRFLWVSFGAAFAFALILRILSPNLAYIL